MPATHIGDVISVPLRGADRDPNGVLSREPAGRKPGWWVVDADGSTLKVETAAKCPTVAEVVAAAVAPKKAVVK